MKDETQDRSAGAVDAGGRSRRGEGESAPLQSRAKFLKNWGWPSVTQINAGLCERGGAQRGVNSETHQALAEEWEAKRSSELTLLETFVFLKACHRRAPFLFYNGNTFAEIGRGLATALFSDLPTLRRKEAASLVAHCITGVLDEGLMREGLNSLSSRVSFKPGDRVKTIRGSLRGTVQRVLEDGRIVWKRENGGSELLSLPEGLLPEH
jgi:hypothetical protein